jgi:2-keto-4-pentenoate hydratase/2-oxohepta-3-ene-1,7-dioic acid hydratase in catechol pathway
MKIICIGKNYGEHNKEMQSEHPKNPVFFLKTDNCILRQNKPFYLPSFSSCIHHEVEIVVRICRVGKHIDTAFASKYYKEIGIGLDLTARDLQNDAKKQGLPWEISKAFDFSAPLSDNFIPKADLDLDNLSFSLRKNGEIVQKGNTKDMIFNIDTIIAYVSRFITLKIGDLIFTGTPSGVGPLAIGDELEAFIENKSLLKMKIK